MNKLSLKPEYDYIMIQYGNKKYRLSAHEIMEHDSQDPFVRHIFEIITQLGVDEENTRLVETTIEKMTNYPNQIWHSGKAGKILTELSNRFPGSGVNTDEAMMARQAIHGIRHDTRNKYIPLDRGEEIK